MWVRSPCNRRVTFASTRTRRLRVQASQDLSLIAFGSIVSSGWVHEFEGLRVRCGTKQICSSARFTRDLLGPGQDRGHKAARGSEGKPQSRNRAVARQVDEVSADRRRKTAEDSGGQGVRKRESCGSYIDRHDFRQEYDHRTVVA